MTILNIMELKVNRIQAPSEDIQFEKINKTLHKTIEVHSGYG